MIAEEQVREEAKTPDISADVPQITVEHRSYLFVKRFFDVFIAFFAGLVLLIPMLLIGLLIRMESPGPAVFRQERMGKDGKTFTIYKFRTMRLAAPRDLAARSFSDSDLYITRMGAFLRRTSIDELPQLLNILIGDMSLVGYRPVCLTETELNEMRLRQGVFTIRPGITGLAQVSGRDSIGNEEKVRLDAQYVRECSLKMDIYCLVKTVTTVITGEGVM